MRIGKMEIEPQASVHQIDVGEWNCQMSKATPVNHHLKYLTHSRK